MLITIVKNETIKKITLANSMTISDFFHEYGIYIDRPCSGKGTCGKCAVKADGILSPLSKNESKALSQEQISGGYRLACEAYIKGDCKILMEEQSVQSIETRGNAEFSFVSEFENKTINATVPTLDNQLTDYECLNTDMEISLFALKKLPFVIRESKYSPKAVICNNRILDVATKETDITGVAIDIGTTTVAAYFYNLKTGELIDTQSGLNTQRTYGADVISRIEHSQTKGGLDELQNAIVSLINELIEKSCKKTNQRAENIFKITVAANTTMLHLLCGINPSAIACSPFIAATSFGFCVNCSDLKINAHSQAFVYLIPSVSAYVGGDIVAGIAASGLCNNSLFIDVGTNGEMAIKSGDKIIACSVAAGPAFEGAHIKHGTGGISGAVCSVKYQNGDFITETIDNKAPVGICGSGIIDAVAALLDAQVLDMTGRLAEPDEMPAQLKSRLKEDEFVICENITVTAQDIREVQLAKAAVCAGVHVLIKEAGLTLESVEQVIIAGGFGSHINKESACRIGLFPKELLEKITVAGNAAGMGACKALLEPAKNIFDKLAKDTQYIELSGNQDFMDCYIEQMIFE